MAKVLSTGKKAFIKGGNGHMVGKQRSGPQTPGKLVATPKGGGKWTSGGGSKMVGFTGSQKAKPC